MNDWRNIEGTILISGGAGYIGSRIIRDLAIDPIFDGCLIRIYDNLHHRHYCGLIDLHSKNRSEMIECDILNCHNLQCSMQGVQSVVHLVALVRTPLIFDHPNQINKYCKALVIECAVEAEISEFVYVSSTSVFGPECPFLESDTCFPPGPYAVAKRMAEQALEFAFERGLPAVTNRLGTTFGTPPVVSFKAIAYQLAYMVVCGKPMVVHGKGEQVHPLVHISAASAAIFLSEKLRQTFWKDNQYNNGQCVGDIRSPNTPETSARSFGSFHRTR